MQHMQYVIEVCSDDQDQTWMRQGGVYGLVSQGVPLCVALDWDRIRRQMTSRALTLMVGDRRN